MDNEYMNEALIAAATPLVIQMQKMAQEESKRAIQPLLERIEELERRITELEKRSTPKGT